MSTDQPPVSPSAPVATSKPTVPTTQKSWHVTASGEPAKVLKFGDVPVPKPGKGDVLVKVQAAALNPIGYKSIKWLPSVVARRSKAHEFDLAGVVVDANGTEFKEGDEIIGINPVPVVYLNGYGALAQYTRVSASRTVLRPKNVTPTQASGLPLAGLTAYQALFHQAKLEEGQSVFINGGSTAVGSFAIQLAKAKGARVAVSASGKNEQYVRSLGADEFFDYTKAPLHEQLIASDPNPKYHVFLEAVGVVDTALFVESEKYLAPGGVFLSVGPQGSGYLKFFWKVLLQPTWLGGTKRTWKLVSVDPAKKDLEHFAKLVEEGEVKPIVDSVYSFEDTLKAYERILTGRATGKVVVKVDPTVE